MANELPKNWKFTTVHQISSLLKGVSYKKKDAKGIKEDDDFLILRGGNIQDGKIVITEKEVFVDSSIVKQKQKLQIGDVIIVGSTGSKKLIGKAAIVTDEMPETSFGAFLMLLRPTKLLQAKYFDYYFISEEYRRKIRELAGGININNIRRSYIEELKFPLPPLAEQERIVAKLDDLFEGLDKIKASLDKIPVLLKNFRQQVLTRAVTGKLTEEWREGKNLEEWEEKLMKNACEKVQSGGTPKGSKFETEGIPFFKVYNIVDQKISFDYKPQFISREIQDSQCKKSISYAGDVLMNIVGPPLNKVAIIPHTFPECNINQAITLFRPNENLLNKYLYYFLREGSPVNSLINETRGVVGQVNISLTQCRNFKIKIPPIKEQKEIVNRVESLFAKADAIESQYENLKAKIEQLPQAILHKTFKGELVPQLESDGDAKDLLKEIEALKGETAPTIKKKTKKKAYTTSKTKLSQAAESESGYGN